MDDLEKMRQSIEGLKESSKYQIELLATMAHMNRAYFVACVEQGFSEEQALQLVLRTGLTLQGGK